MSCCRMTPTYNISYAMTAKAVSSLHRKAVWRGSEVMMSAMSASIFALPHRARDKFSPTDVQMETAGQQNSLGQTVRQTRRVASLRLGAMKTVLLAALSCYSCLGAVHGRDMTSAPYCPSCTVMHHEKQAENGCTAVRAIPSSCGWLSLAKPGKQFRAL